jgi:hypothetical protein
VPGLAAGCVDALRDSLLVVDNSRVLSLLQPCRHVDRRRYVYKVVQYSTTTSEPSRFCLVCGHQMLLCQSLSLTLVMPSFSTL